MIDQGIQAAPNVWGYRVGADIGGKEPSDYKMVQGTPASATAAQFRTSGEPYTDWLAHSDRWIPPGSSAFVMDFDLWLDCRVAKAAQCLEFDLKSKTFDFSAQLNIAGGWAWQVDKAGPVWVNAVSLRPLSPCAKHHLAISGKFDAKTFSPLSVTIDGMIYAISTTLQNQPATNTDWAPGVANVQIQLDANATGGTFAIEIDNLNVTWS